MQHISMLEIVARQPDTSVSNFPKFSYIPTRENAEIIR